MNKYCDTFHIPSPLTELQDFIKSPPPLDQDIPLLKQWQLSVSEMRRHESLFLHAYRDGDRLQDESLGLRAMARGPARVEIITEMFDSVFVSQTMGDASPDFTLRQRWLLPINSFDLPGRATALARTSESIIVRCGSQIVTFSVKDWSSRVWNMDEHSNSAPGDIFGDHTLNKLLSGLSAAGGTVAFSSEERFDDATRVLSLTLMNDKIVAVKGSSLIVAIPVSVMNADLHVFVEEKEVPNRY